MNQVFKIHQKTVNTLVKLMQGASFYDLDADELNYHLKFDPDPLILNALYDSGVLTPAIFGKGLLHFFVELDLDHSSYLDRHSPIRTMESDFYIESRIQKIKSLEKFSQFIKNLFSPHLYQDTIFSRELAVDKLNQYLKYDGYEICAVKQNNMIIYDIRPILGQLVEFNPEEKEYHPLSHEYVNEQIQKCDQKLAQSDYSGAITNARTLIEEVLKAIQAKLDPTPKDTGGDLMKLYKEVQRLLSLDPATQHIESLKQLLTGLTSIINGISALRNHSGDAHAARFRPSEHHAKLAVNAAKTICNFLFESFEYQLEKGKIKLVDTQKQAIEVF